MPVLLLKFALSIFFILVVVLQFFSFPGQFRFMAEQEPESAHLRWPLTTLFIVIFLAIELLIITVWKVVHHLGDDNKKTYLLRYVKMGIAALTFLWIVIASALAWLFLNADDPGLPLLVTVIEVAVSIVGLLLIIYKNHLLRH